MIEVFKTNVHKATEANQLVLLLLNHFPGSKINFDLEDCDKVLRVEGIHFVTEKVMNLLKESGFQCAILE
jgi:hypothetical protein